MGELRKLGMAEVRKHDKEGDFWVVILGKVYDLSDFLHLHPGGMKILMPYAGRVADEGFKGANHNPETITGKSPPVRCVGIIDTATVTATDTKPVHPDDWIKRDERAWRHGKWNAETPVEMLGNDYATPNGLFFIRSHGPVPKILAADDHQVRIEGLGMPLPRPCRLSRL